MSRARPWPGCCHGCSTLARTGVRAGFDGRVLWVLTDHPDAELFQVVPGQPDPR